MAFDIAAASEDGTGGSAWRVLRTLPGIPGSSRPSAIWTLPKSDSALSGATHVAACKKDEKGPSVCDTLMLGVEVIP